MSRDPAGVHQQATDYFQSFKCFFLLSQPDILSVKTDWAVPFKISRLSGKGENN